MLSGAESLHELKEARIDPYVASMNALSHGSHESILSTALHEIAILELIVERVTPKGE